MPLSTPLDRDLAMTEISLQSAALAATVRTTIADCAARIVTQYPSCGLTEFQVAAELCQHLARRREFVSGLPSDLPHAPDHRNPGNGGRYDGEQS